MKLYALVLPVCYLIVNLHLYHSYIIDNNDSKLLIIKQHVIRLIGILFSKEDTIHFIFVNHMDVFLLKKIKNPFVISNINRSIRMSLKSYYNYVIYIENLKYLNYTLPNLIYSPMWHEKNSPRGHFLIITSSEDYLKESLEYLWKFNIINLIIIVENVHNNNCALKIYRANPFESSSKCARFAKINFIGCSNSISNLTFLNNKPTLQGCHFKVVHSVDIKDLMAGRREVFTNVIKIINLLGELLKASVSFEIEHDIKRSINNETNDITLSSFLVRLGNLYENYDVSDYFLSDDMVWILPKSPTVSGYKILTSIFKMSTGMLIFGIILMVTFFMWLGAIFISERIAFRNLLRCLLGVLVFTIGSATNIVPRTNALRTLTVFYLLYCMQISNIFQGQLISVLTEPEREPPIETIEEFSKFYLPIVAPMITRQVMLMRINESVYKRIMEKATFKESFNMEDNVIRVALYRNVTTLSGKFIISKTYPQLRTMVDIIDHDTGLLPLELVVYMKKGHYVFDILNKLLSRITESGFQDKALNEIFEKKPIKLSQTDKLNISLRLEHLSIIFQLWAAGLVSATLVFLLEIVTKCYLL